MTERIDNGEEFLEPEDDGGQLNVDPLRPPHDWKDPDYKYVPDGTLVSTQNARVFTSNLIMLVIDSNCPASPGGIYSSVQIAKSWIPWLRALPCFGEVGYVEERHEPHQVTYHLWRLEDWKQTANARALRDKELTLSTLEWWRQRYRFYRAVNRLRNLAVGGNLGEHAARLAVENFYETRRQLPQAADMLDRLGWHEEIPDESLDTFRDQWRSKKGHCYQSPFDLTQEESE